MAGGERDPGTDNPLLVLALHDDNDAVSVLDHDHIRGWLDRTPPRGE